MFHYSKPLPSFFPLEYKINAGIILSRTFGITVDGISHGNCRNIYLQLVHLITTLLQQGVPVCSRLELSNTSDSDEDNSDTY